MAMASLARRKAYVLSRNLSNSSNGNVFKYSFSLTRGFASASDENDVVVIGGGPGGYVAAIKAAQLGLKTTCIEKRGALGGTCLNVGCIPSKALLHSSHMYHEAMHSFASHGVKFSSVEVDLPAMMAQKDKAVSNLTRGIEGLFKKNKVTYVKGYGKFISPYEVSVDTIEGGNTVVKGKNIIIATGSDVKSLPGITIDEKRIVSSTGALALNEVPKKLVVIGAGYIGLEMGSVWGRLGSEVTVVEFAADIVPSMDGEIRKQFQRSLEKQKMKFMLKTKVVGVDISGDGVKLTLEPAAGGEKTILEADVVLVSAGRTPFTAGLGLEVKFLIRASFMYGNYDGQDIPPSFDLMLGADVWDSVQLQDSDGIITKEIIHMPNKGYIHVCLVHTYSGTPFISALELRPITNSIYATQSGSLSRYFRWDVGSTTNETFRYPDDVCDRIWSPNSFYYWAPISTSSNVDSTGTINFNLPSTVMQTAVIPANGVTSLEFHWVPVNRTFKYYVYMHFSEVGSDLAKNQTREMYIYFNGDKWHGPLSPSHLETVTVYSTSPMTNHSRYDMEIRATDNSSLPPILNALEVYQVKEFPQLLTHQQDVDAITNIKSKYEVKRDWQGDPCTPKVHLWQGLNCSYDDNQPPRIISLNLSSSGISGEIDPYIFSLTSIESLDLSNNSLTGLVPDFLAELESLTVLNLSGNNLQGSLPAGLVEKANNRSLSLSVERNPNLCLSDSCKKKNNRFIVPVLASVVTFSVFLAALVILQHLRRRKQAKKKKGSLETKNRKFSYFDLLKITNNFERVLGKGGFGTVYHGYLDDKQVAVKMLSPSSVQGYKQFQAEVELLMRAHHKNLTILVGYCDEGTNMGLIYEFMANGNLQAHILEDKADILSWEGRLQIATESAQGLEYLHNGCKPPIVHRDVKSANILLNEKFQAKLADFGLSRIFPVEGGSHVSTTVVGTPGYLDPEYYISNRLTEKSDVYSFGVVLLELITGQPVIQKTPERTHIGQWVSSMLARGDIKNIVDQRLQGDFDTNTVWKAVEIAMACIHSISTRRPTMNQVVIELNDCLAMQIARTKAHGTAPDGTPDELMMHLNLQSDVFPLAR